MKVLLTTESRLQRTPDGAYWTAGSGQTFYEQYLDVFDEVMVVARVRDVLKPTEKLNRADGEHIRFHHVPHYHGPWQFLLKRRTVIESVCSALTFGDAVILRDGNMAHTLGSYLVKIGYPFGYCVVGDPYDVFAPGASSSRLRPLMRCWCPMQLRKMCRNAIGVTYVTDQILQKRYPASPEAFCTSFSNVMIPCFAESPRTVESFTKKSFNLLFVGSLESPYKSADVLVEAIARCRDSGLNVHVHLVGKGKFAQVVDHLIKKYDLASCFTRTESLNTMQLVEAMRQSDLFIMPSRTEGLPRAMIEAMALGLPCIGTKIGGIPELLSESDLVPVGSIAQLAQKITEVLLSPQRLAEMSQRNLTKASNYRTEILDQKRQEFYRFIKNKTTEYGQHVSR